MTRTQDSAHERAIKESKSLVEVFYRVSEIEPERAFLHAVGTIRRPEDTEDAKTGLTVLSYRQARAHVTALAQWLIKHDIKQGDRVFLLSENRSEWLLWDLAVMAVGGVSVPLFTTANVDDWNFILTDSGARMGMVSSEELFRLMQRAIIGSEVEQIVLLSDFKPMQSGVAVTEWREIISQPVSSEARALVESRAAPLGEDSTALLCYTSGTSGRPRGVIQTHGNLLANQRQIMPVLYELPDFVIGEETFLSVLPMGHAYEHTVGVHFALAIGSRLWYPPSIDRLVTFLGVARPTLMMAVPRLLEILRERITTTARRGKPILYWLFQQTITTGMQIYAKELGPLPEPLSPPKLWQRILYATFGTLVRKKAQRSFGGRLKALISGGGPLNPEVAGFFRALGLLVLQGYGQTETAPVVSVNIPKSLRHDTVGFPLPGVSVRLATDGEIEVSGKNILPGYWRNESANANLFTQDGWVRTGDIGVFLPTGHLKIIDRKKDILINSAGDNVSPQRVEGQLCLEESIDQALVYGDRKPHLVAVLVPSEALRTAMDDGTLLKQERDRLLSESVDRINKRLGKIERIRSFIVAKEAFTTANAMLTPSLKIRRKAIIEQYGDELESLYQPSGRGS